MSTDTPHDTSTTPADELADLYDFDPECDMCESPADWIARTICCGQVAFACDRHRKHADRAWFRVWLWGKATRTIAYHGPCMTIVNPRRWYRWERI